MGAMEFTDGTGAPCLVRAVPLGHGQIMLRVGDGTCSAVVWMTAEQVGEMMSLVGDAVEADRWLTGRLDAKASGQARYTRVRAGGDEGGDRHGTDVS